MGRSFHFSSRELCSERYCGPAFMPITDRELALNFGISPRLICA
jgi:hypothetical protein